MIISIGYPVISLVFNEIWRADELGSGVRNIYEYYSYYSKQKPLLQEKDVFKCTVFVDEELIPEIDKAYNNISDNITVEKNRVGDELTDNQ